jgi:TonB family protein
MGHARMPLRLLDLRRGLRSSLFVKARSSWATDPNGAKSPHSGCSRLGRQYPTFGLLFWTLFAGSVTVNAQSGAPPIKSVDGALRRLAEKDLLLRTDSGKVLRFRLILRTEFRGGDGKPIRDSLIHPGDRIAIEVNPDDLETALYVIFVSPGSASAREAASAPVEETSIVLPDPSDVRDGCVVGAPNCTPYSAGPPLPNSAPPVAVEPPRVANPPEVTVNAKDGLRYVWIPPGAFVMGCSPGDTECLANEKPPHAAQIANGLWMGQTEVTQAAFRKVMGGNPSAHKGDLLPVETVTWNDAVNYCEIVGGRLPTETEWEYAARAGTTNARYGSLDAVAWHAGNCAGTTHPVGLKQPNAFRLYDMIGNVWEWVQDSYPGGSEKILRGGSCFVIPVTFRASFRLARNPSDAKNGAGFRCVMDRLVPNARASVGSGGGGEVAGEVFGTGDGVSAPAVTYWVDPGYSEEARKAKYGGVVMLSVVVDSEGRARDIHVVKSLGMGLDDKAIEAVQKWKFRPGTKDGKPVNVRATIEVNFRLL